MRADGIVGGDTGKNTFVKTEVQRHYGGDSRGMLSVVGIGPGDLEHMSFKAHRIIREAEVIVGYNTYIALIQELISPEQVVISTGMMQEIDRCEAAVQQAASGKSVVVVSSGDAGVYGMAGIVLELIDKLNVGSKVTYEVIPGISAVNAAAATLGAPLMHDFAVISLSDLLTPWPKITERVEHAAQADFVIALYNPKSQKRVQQIEEVQDILLKFKPASTPVGIVRNAKRADESMVITNLADFTKQSIDMFSLVLIGNSQTYVLDGRMVTPRGYKL
jgi:precorrin-3B C17-methyltransferase